MRRAMALLMIAGFLGTSWGAAGPAAAQGPIVAQFWYSFGGTNREVTEAHIKRFNESQSKYRIEGTFQGDYFEALAKIRAAAAEALRRIRETEQVLAPIEAGIPDELDAPARAAAGSPPP